MFDFFSNFVELNCFLVSSECKQFIGIPVQVKNLDLLKQVQDKKIFQELNDLTPTTRAYPKYPSGLSIGSGLSEGLFTFWFDTGLDMFAAKIALSKAINIILNNYFSIEVKVKQ